MPLLKGKSNIGRNIRELEEHGTRARSKKQILAIALHVADPAGGSLKSMAGAKKRK